MILPKKPVVSTSRFKDKKFNVNNISYSVILFLIFELHEHLVCEYSTIED